MRTDDMICSDSHQPDERAVDERTVENVNFGAHREIFRNKVKAQLVSSFIPNLTTGDLVLGRGETRAREIP